MQSYGKEMISINLISLLAIKLKKKAEFFLQKYTNT